MTTKLLDLYTSILSAAGLSVDREGYVSTAFGVAEPGPATVDGKRLVLPTPEQLATAMGTERIAFHPLSENILRGESEVLSYLRQALNTRLNITFSILALELMQIATSPTEHSRLSPDQQEFLSQVKNADEKTYHTLERLVKAMPANQTQQAFCSIYLKRSGTVGGQRFARVGVVTFPLYQELVKAKDSLTVFGVKLPRQRDREEIMALMEYMIPGIADAESHHRGSSSTVAPYMDALMKAVMVVAGPLNDLCELFRSALSSVDDLVFDSSWVDAFENLKALEPQIRMIPMQAGNEGSAGVAPVGANISAQPSAGPAFSATPTPTVHPAAAPAQVVQMVDVYGRPVVAPVQPAAPVKTANGLDFNSVLAANPALAYSVGGGFNAPPPMNPMMQQRREPRWASGGGMGSPMGTYQTSYGTGHGGGFGST